ncbi:MAG: transcription antitermination factor NusB [Rickettsiales bacterium]|nr:transcription antitermination factor NusB [Rickettsiales bacterium]|tara:strand:+ start:50 stop:484 length:435 start_codon:yes stop_codon:yes gene_type:complete
MQARRNSRLAAVQAIFQYYFLKQDIESVMEEFCKYRLIEKKNYDIVFFRQLVSGVDEKQETIKKYITNSLSEKWMIERLDYTIQSIISLGIYELISCNSIPLKVVINEYVSISSLYFDDSNIGFVNGVLDNLGKIIRNEVLINE